MPTQRSSIALAIGLLATIAFVVPAGASAARPRRLHSGTMVLTPVAAAGAALVGNGIGLSPLAPASVKPEGIILPINGGRINGHRTGRIATAGGVRITKGDAAATERGFTLVVSDEGAKLVGRLGSDARDMGKVSMGPVSMGKVSMGPVSMGKVSMGDIKRFRVSSNGAVTAEGTVALSRRTAMRLNELLDTTAFVAGPFATVKVHAR
jgi:hypothetical protein